MEKTILEELEKDEIVKPYNGWYILSDSER